MDNIDLQLHLKFIHRFIIDLLSLYKENNFTKSKKDYMPLTSAENKKFVSVY